MNDINGSFRRRLALSILCMCLSVGGFMGFVIMANAYGNYGPWGRATYFMSPMFSNAVTQIHPVVRGSFQLSLELVFVAAVCLIFGILFLRFSVRYFSDALIQSSPDQLCQPRRSETEKIYRCRMRKLGLIRRHSRHPARTTRNSES